MGDLPVDTQEWVSSVQDGERPHSRTVDRWAHAGEKWEADSGETMARGWESKSVEAQQDAMQAPKSAARALTPQEAARKAERATLALARSRALADLQTACVPAHRAMLEQAIADLDRRLALLD